MSWDALRNCSMVTFCTLSLLSAITTDFIAEIIYKKETSPSPFLPIDATFSSYSFTNYSMFCSKIMDVIILLLLNICQHSSCTIKNPLVSHRPLAKASFLSPFSITEGTESHPIFLSSCRELRTLKQEFYLCSKSMAH